MDDKQRLLTIGLALLGDAMITLGIAMATGFSTATIGIGVLFGAIVGAIGWLGTLIAKDWEERDAKANFDSRENMRDFLKYGLELAKYIPAGEC